MSRSYPQTRHGSFVDKVLVALYLVGIYLGIAFQLPGGVPVPQVVAGLAGFGLLMKHAGQISTRHVVPVIVVLVLAVCSILTAPDYGLLNERFKGFVQFTYAMMITYGFFLAARTLSARWLARFFMAFCVAIIVGCAMENAIPAFKAVSDAFRGWVFESGVYDSDIRDIGLYGQVRPKLFTSEPSFVAFSFTLFAFAWYVVSRMPAKAIVYIVMLAVGYEFLRSPTMLIGVGLVPAYEILIASRGVGRGGMQLNWSRATVATVVSAILAVAGLIVATVVFAARIEEIVAGNDPSFFARIIAPPMLALEILAEYPLTGVGMTGWEFLDAKVQQIYATTSWLSLELEIESAQHAITNYFWLHWIFLGLFWGLAVLAAMSWYIARLGVPSVLFCWGVWAVFGQAAGGWVDPRTWTVLLLAAAVSVVHQRDKRMARHAVEVQRMRRRQRMAAMAPTAPIPVRPRLVSGYS
ncbi:MAG: hypothetical protein WD270_07910 [Acetobacterales bacterium]